MRGTAVLYISYGCYALVDSGGDTPMPADTEGANLIFPSATDSGGAVIGTGTFWGPIDITVETLTEAPGPAEVGSWEITDQGTLDSEGAEIIVSNLDGGGGEELPHLVVTPGQPYHVRVSARGFSAGQQAGELTDEGAQPVETHLVQLWTETD